MSVIKSALSVWFYQWTWPLKLASFIAILLVTALVVGGIRSCGKRPPRIDQAAVDRINAANAAERKKELTRVIEDNADAVTTVDERTTIAETNVVERNREIDEKVKAADAKIAEAKRQGKDVTQEELECLLTGEGCK